MPEHKPYMLDGKRVPSVTTITGCMDFGKSNGLCGIVTAHTGHTPPSRAVTYRR